MKSKQTNKQQVESAFALRGNEKSHNAGGEWHEITTQEYRGHQEVSSEDLRF